MLHNYNKLLLITNYLVHKQRQPISPSMHYELLLRTIDIPVKPEKKDKILFFIENCVSHV